MVSIDLVTDHIPDATTTLALAIFWRSTIRETKIFPVATAGAKASHKLFQQAPRATNS